MEPNGPIFIPHLVILVNVHLEPPKEPWESLECTLCNPCLYSKIRDTGIIGYYELNHELNPTAAYLFTFFSSSGTLREGCCYSRLSFQSHVRGSYRLSLQMHSWRQGCNPCRIAFPSCSSLYCFALSAAVIFPSFDLLVVGWVGRRNRSITVCLLLLSPVCSNVSPYLLYAWSW